MRLILISILFLCSNINADPLTPLPIDFFDDKKIKSKKENHSSKKINKKKNYDKLIKDIVSIPGFFDFYMDKGKNKVYLSINPNQFDVEF